MFLMFRLHRPDVLPVGDLGIVNAVQRMYKLRKRPARSGERLDPRHEGKGGEPRIEQRCLGRCEAQVNRYERADRSKTASSGEQFLGEQPQRSISKPNELFATPDRGEKRGQL